MMAVGRYVEHVQELVRQRGGGWHLVAVPDDSGDRGHCDPVYREIAGPAIENAADYAVWLHEIGHSYQTVDSSRFWQNPVPHECEAWEWAIVNALEWTNAMQDELERCLQRYTDRPEWGVPSNTVRCHETVCKGRERAIAHTMRAVNS